MSFSNKIFKYRRMNSYEFHRQSLYPINYQPFFYSIVASSGTLVYKVLT